MPQRPNILLICVDQWRADCLGVDGHIVETPYLNSLALDGVRFARAYSATPTCIAARAALFTGLSQRSHGRVGYQDGVPWNYPTTLAGELTAAGYQTQAVGKMHVYPERSQLGFQNVILHDGYLHFVRRRNPDLGVVDDYIPWLRDQLGRQDADYYEHGVDCNGHVARPWDKPEHTHPTNWVTSESIDFLRRRDTRKPFMLFVSYHRPHPPYDPPQWAFERYLNQSMPPVPVGDWAGEFDRHADPRRAVCNAGRIDHVMLQRARAGYYGHMTHIDHQLNRLWDALVDRQVADNTWVLFVSDHGELLGDHNLFRKSLPYEGSARVPLIIKPPRGTDIARGAVRAEVAELRDVMPTVLEMAGVPVPAGTEGQSLLPLCKQGAAPQWRSYIHGEHGSFAGAVHYVARSNRKYVWFAATGREQLFDLARDPQELHDLAADPSRAAELAEDRQTLVRELTGREEGFVDGGRLTPGRPTKQTLSHVAKAPA
jgi:arylsulfatase A-like enzyme